MVFDEVPERFSFPENEEMILRQWEENDTFKESVRQSEGRKPYSFYDGPPFATGLPHYGHILAGTIKDIVCRYAHQTGHYVPRRFGWDCHGLPIEYEIDKSLGITGRDDVLKMGIDKYNSECRGIVMRYSKEWEKTVKRVGRWIDFENDYKTMHVTFMETVWWVFKQLHDKGLIYRGFKVMPYSMACSTPLSNFEVQQNYKEVDDPSVVCTFPLIGDDDGAMFVAWTTTPWTLPSNLALCVNPDLEYVKIKDAVSGKVYILMAARLVQLFPELGNEKKKKEALKKFVELERFPGAVLKDKEYTPPFEYFASTRATGSFRVITGSFVTAESGTGIVHCAPAFGEEDYKVCMAHGVVRRGEKLPCPIDANGRFTNEVPDFEGRNVKDADKDIIKVLKEKGRILRSDPYRHSYPFCWRSDTPLIYRAVPGTFVAVETIKERLVENNKQTYWVPSFVKEKRFHNWLENARDWAVSRNRFWGTPIPMWVSDDGEEVWVAGSIAELEEKCGQKIEDLHREYIDHITIPSSQGRGPLRRVDEVFDCWFESGSMPYAQCHYPFENKEAFEASFPADFIAEGIDQTRGWFYTLMVLSTALFDKPAFKNLICNGLVLAEDGQKMSKRKQNYPKPEAIMDTYGADALRLYLINSPVVRADDLKFKEAGVKQNLKDIFLPWYHAYRLFVQTARLQETQSGSPFKPDTQRALSSKNLMDRWILAAANGLVDFMRSEMEAYRLYTVVPRLVDLVEQLTNWYIRMNKERFSGERGTEDRADSLCTLFEVLLMLCRMMAPLTPFFCELMYQNLRNAIPDAPASVHFMMIPEVNREAVDPTIETAVKHMQCVIEKGRAIRDRNGLNMRTPLREVTLVHGDKEALGAVEQLQAYISEELNVRTVRAALVSEVPDLVRLKCLPNHKLLGARFGPTYKNIQAKIRALNHDQLAEFVATGVLVIEEDSFSADDILVQMEYAGEKGVQDVDSVEGGLVLLHCKPDVEMLSEAMAREVCAKIQKMRKEAGMRKEDEIEVCYGAAAGSVLSSVLKQQSEYVASRIGRTLLPSELRPSRAVRLLSEEKEVRLHVLTESGEIEQKSETLTLELIRGCPFFDAARMKTLLPDEALREDVSNYVHCLDVKQLRATLTAEGAEGMLRFTLNKVKVALRLGEHFFLTCTEAMRAGAL